MPPSPEQIAELLEPADRLCDGALPPEESARLSKLLSYCERATNFGNAFWDTGSCMLRSPGAVAEAESLSWFSVNWNSDRLALSSGEGHPAKMVAASSREGLLHGAKTEGGLI
ncbi:MAG: hypothetical protein K8T91_03720 [Planctomycetes bacterium]|nr:hypothetical protein [Planctomycetota bacterium]